MDAPPPALFAEGCPLTLPDSTRLCLTCSCVRRRVPFSFMHHAGQHPHVPCLGPKVAYLRGQALLFTLRCCVQEGDVEAAQRMVESSSGIQRARELAQQHSQQARGIPRECALLCMPCGLLLCMPCRSWASQVADWSEPPWRQLQR